LAQGATLLLSDVADEYARVGAVCDKLRAWKTDRTYSKSGTSGPPPPHTHTHTRAHTTTTTNTLSNLFVCRSYVESYAYLSHTDLLAPLVRLC
jgi:hypothetical protein